MAREELRSKEIEVALTGDNIWPEDEMASIEMVENAIKESFLVAGEDLRSRGRGGYRDRYGFPA